MEESKVYSLINDLKTPKEWFSKESLLLKSNEWVKYFNVFCSKYSLFRQDDKFTFNVISDFITTFTIQVYPMANKKEFKFAWLVSYFGTLLDKHGDSDKMTDCSSELIKKCQYLMFIPSNEIIENFNQLLQNVTTLEERSIIVFCYKVSKYCKKQNIKWMGDDLKAEFSRWMDSLVPYKDLKQGSIETFLFLRHVNVGHPFYMDLTLIMSIKTLDPMILFSSGVFKKMCYLCSKEISLVNDIYSFEKEIIADPNSPNYLNQLIKNENMSFNQAYIYLVDYINQLYSDILQLKCKYLKDTKSNFQLSNDQCIELDQIIGNIFYGNGGNLKWSGECIRYATHDSVFLELKQTFKKNKEKFFKDKKFLDS